jgi:hypothetical protein
VWHLNKNVLKNCKPIFSTGDDFNSFMEDWKSLCYSDSEETFDSNYKQFQDTWAAYSRAVQYVDRKMYPLRRKFVAAWTNQVRHFGCTSTSRVEGMHSQVKKYIRSSREDILGVCTVLKLAVENQLNQISIIFEQQKIVNNYRLNPLFSEVKNKISEHALDLASQQVKLERPLKECSRSFNQIYGIPCGHDLDTKMLNHEKLQPSDFCSQWNLFQLTDEITQDSDFDAQLKRIQNIVDAGRDNTRRTIAIQLEGVARNSNISNPAVVAKGRGRPVGSVNTTTRELSGFEYVEAATEAVEFEQRLVHLCKNLKIYLQSHTYSDIIEVAKSQAVSLVGFNQSMCSMMKLGKSCVKNRDTVNWLTKFLSRNVENNDVIDDQ